MRKLTVLMLVVVMVLGLMLIAVVAREPVNKVTGEIWIDSGEEIQHLEFDVHDRKGKDKGYVYWWTEDEPGGDWIYRTSPVLCCNFVDENTAWFAIGPDPDRPEDLPAGCLVLKVVDGGSPGAVYDEVYAQPLPDPGGGGREDDACAMVDDADDEDLLGIPTILWGDLVVYYMVGARGPVNKVTGEVWIEIWQDVTLIQENHIEFVAYETDDKDESYIKFLNLGLEGPILCCNVVDENTAWLAWGSEEHGKWTVAKFEDGGSPGALNDKVYFKNFYGIIDPGVCDIVTEAEIPLEEITPEIVEGNIVVHYYVE